MGVEEIGQGGKLFRPYRQLGPQQLALHPAVVGHHHRDKTLLIHRQQVVPPDGNTALAHRRRIGRVADKGGHHLARLGDDAVQLPHFSAQGLVDLGGLLIGHAPPLHQLVDVQPVPLGGRHPARRGVGLLQVAQLRQVRQFVADGGGADGPAHGLGDEFGAHRLGGVNVPLGDHL